MIDDRHWGEVDPETDSWCFMCAKRGGVHNPYFSKLLEMFTKPQPHQSTIELCHSVQQYYDEHFKRVQGRPWTLRSIRNHQYEHLGWSSAMMYADLIRTLSAQLVLLGDTSLRVADRSTGQRFVNDRGMRSYMKCVRMILRVFEQSEE